MYAKMKRCYWIAMVPVVLLAAACGSDPTPTLTPVPATPTATPNVQATIDAAIAATAAAMPTVTPTATPTATPRPTPVPPTATAPPTATTIPTPTVSPSLVGAIPLVEASVVQVISGTVQISGVVIDPLSLVLTASLPLGDAPLATIITKDGQALTGWVVGRDDVQNLALLRIIDASLPGIPLGDSSTLEPGDKVLSFGYPVASQGQLSAIESSIVDDRKNQFSGLRFLEMNTGNRTGTVGGPLVNHLGELVAMSVGVTFVQDQGFSVSQDNFAMATEFIQTALPRLQDGNIRLEPRPAPTPSPSAPPPLPAIYSGTVTFKGAFPDEGTRLYARVVQPAIGDVWIRTEVKLNGSYVLPLGLLNALYVNSVVELYLEGVKAEIQGLNTIEQGILRYEPANNRTLDLVFP